MNSFHSTLVAYFNTLLLVVVILSFVSMSCGGESHPNELFETDSSSPTSNDSGNQDKRDSSSPISNDSDNQDKGDSSSPTSNDSGNHDIIDLCDGTEGIRLYSTRKGGAGVPQPGSQVMSENGYTYIIIEGDCKFWAYDNSDGIAYTGTLSDSDEESITSRFLLHKWTEWTGEHINDRCYDAPDFITEFGGKKVWERQSCEGSELDWLQNALSTTLEELKEKGKPWNGDIRYCLKYDQAATESTVPDLLEYRSAPSWPLDTEPTTIAITEAQSYEDLTGQSLLAADDDAATLRELRRTYLNGDIGNVINHFIPIEEETGTRYNLFVRDSIRLEDDKGLLPFN